MYNLPNGLYRDRVPRSGISGDDQTVVGYLLKAYVLGDSSSVRRVCSGIFSSSSEQPEVWLVVFPHTALL